MKRFELLILGIDDKGNETAWVPMGNYDTFPATKQAMRDMIKVLEKRKWKIYDRKHDISSEYLTLHSIQSIGGV